jgi:membrane protease YdiL (CAAX protease family)
VVAVLTISATGIQAPMSSLWAQILRYKLGGCFIVSTTLLWFVLPLFYCWKRFRRQDLTFGCWQKLDWWLFAGGALICCAVVFLIPLFADLTNYYVASGHRIDRLRFIRERLVWVASWLPGWELLHRYLLLRSAAFLWPKWGWCLVPLSETVYHLQKPSAEAAGMAAFSVVMTYWSWKRQNLLLPFLLHALIEVTLILYLAG